jgi:hypothetical protein
LKLFLINKRLPDGVNGSSKIVLPHLTISS